MTDNVSDTLNKAADLIQERGWGVGNRAMQIEAEAAPLCLEGGIAAASGLRATDRLSGDVRIADYMEVLACPAYAAVNRYLESRPLDEWTPLAQKEREPWGWNDHPKRTAAEVIEVLRAAALIESARERETASVMA